MKRLLALTLSLAMTLSLAACSNTTSPNLIIQIRQRRSVWRYQRHSDPNL